MAINFINGQPWRQQYAFNLEQSADITGWAAGTSLPGAISSSAAIVTKDRVYLLGGYDAATLSTVYTAPINADGTLGAWATGTSLPGPIRDSPAIVTKDRVYLLGGYTTAAVATVYTAPINADGTLGAWTTGTSLPGIFSHSQAIVTKDRVYLLGGYTPAAVATVYTAPINADGTLGAWTTGPSLPQVLYLSSAIVTKDRVYLLGGYTTAVVATVYTAPINADGTLGAWTTGPSLPGVLYRSQAVVTKDRVYLLGGFATTTVATVYTAPINADGTLGAWTTGTSLPGAIRNSSAIVTKDRVYLLGGYDAATLSTVYTAPFLGGVTDYSTYSYEIIGDPTLEHHQPWGLVYEPAGYQVHAQPYDLTAPLATPLAHLQPWGLALVATHRQPWGDAAWPVLAHVQWYGDAARPILAHVQEYGQAIRAHLVHGQPWALATAARLGHAQPYSLTGDPAHLVHNQPYDLRQLNQALVAHLQAYSLGTPATTDQEITLAAAVDGRALAPIGVAIQADLDSYCLQCRLDLADVADYLACRQRSTLVVTAMGEQYHFVISGRRRNRVPGRTDYTVDADSPTVLLDAPHAAALTREIAAGMASAIAASLAAPHGITVEWLTVDWYVPAGRLFATEETPLQVIRKLAAAAGAVLQSTPAGYVLRVIPAYPVPLRTWATATPSVELSDAADFFTVSEQDDRRPGHNLFWISDQLTSQDSRTLEDTETSPGRHLVRCYVVPWLATLPPLATSGGPWVTVETLGPQTEQRTETVEFIGGVGRTAKPIHALDAMEWLHTSLGSISHGEDGSLQAEVADQSLLRITYTTRYHAWQVSTPYQEDVQFYLDDEEATA